MGHFPHHIPGVSLVHGSPVGISQAGVSNPLAHRVAMLRGPTRTEIRRRPLPTSQRLAMARNPFDESFKGGPIDRTARWFSGGDLWGWVMDQAGQWVQRKLTGGGGGGGGAKLPCVWPAREDPRTGECKVFAGEQTGRDDTMVGDAVMGRYGAGLEPGNRVIDRAVCLRGMVLGNDGICYNRRDIKNSERMWPRGTRPLGTPEEMRAVRIAARFGGRLERTNKRMQKIGLLKKPVARSRKPKVSSSKGITVIDTE